MSFLTIIKTVFDIIYLFIYSQDKIYEWTNKIDAVKDSHFFFIMFILLIIVLLLSILYFYGTEAIEVADGAMSKIRQSPKKIYNYFLGDTKCKIDLEAQKTEEDEWSSPNFKRKEHLFTTPRINRRRKPTFRITDYEYLC